MMYSFPIKDSQYDQVQGYLRGNKLYSIFTIDTDKYRDTSIGILIHGSIDVVVGSYDGEILYTLEELFTLVNTRYVLREVV